MMQRTGTHSYLPLLRWKPAEVRALSKLQPRIRECLFPIMEPCPTAFIRYKRVKDRQYEKRILPIRILSDKLVELKGAIANRPVGIDLIHIKDGESPYNSRRIWDLIIAHQEAVALKVVPVTGFNGKGVRYQELIGSLAREFGNGICLRLSLYDIERRSFTEDMKSLLSLLGHEPSKIDLIVGLKLADSRTPGYAQVSAGIP
jgi:hypothetical protein